ncbi:hypothetical protein V6Z11_D09G175700 [Gossypium hirsutum]
MHVLPDSEDTTELITRRGSVFYDGTTNKKKRLLWFLLL